LRRPVCRRVPVAGTGIILPCRAACDGGAVAREQEQKRQQASSRTFRSAESFHKNSKAVSGFPDDCRANFLTWWKDRLSIIKLDAATISLLQCENKMRRQQHRAVAGQCGCCLVPFVILLIAFIATVVITSLVWHTAATDIFGRGPARYHHFDPYRAGFQEGNRVGVEYAAQDRPEPTAEDLDDLARHRAEDLKIRRDRGRWIEGFRDGFKRGFERVDKEESTSSRQSDRSQ
jgi:hypothetical protein